MRRVTLLVLFGGVISWVVLGNLSHGQPLPTFTDYQWIGGTGTQNWQDNANWDQADFPNDIDSEDEIYPVADLGVGLGADLTVNAGTTPVTIAGLKLGGTLGAVTTEITSGTGGQLVFNNFFESDFLSPTNDADFDNSGSVSGNDFLIWQQNNGTTNPNLNESNYNDSGDADSDNDVDNDDIGIWNEQYGFGTNPLNGNNAFIVSGGVAGSVNRITAPIRLDDEPLGVEANNPLTIDVGGNITNSVGDMASDSRLDVFNGLVTVNSQVIMTNVNTAPETGGTDLQLRATGGDAKLVLNGVVRDANPSEPGNLTFGGGDGWVEIYGDNDLGGTIRTGGRVLLGHDNALGVSSSDGLPALVRPGGTWYSDDNARTIPNPMILQANLNLAGDKTITLSGEITQTNNRGFNNNIEAPGMLILDGTLTIWEDDEPLRREFDFLGTGTTKVTGTIRDDPQGSGNDRGLNMRGPGVVIIDVEDGANLHNGDTVITDGNLHYANNGSLNAGSGKIVSQGGAVGVDTGVASNTELMSKIDPASFGGLMLAPSDAAANLDFTGTLSNASKMTVAAPEDGITYTGTITPANSTYGLGGGSGTLTLPNAQLTGANSLEVRNGGTVELLGDNSYTGKTTVLDRPSDTTLVVDDLADGGVNSSIGAATSDAENILIHGGVVKYVGTGDSTDRLFTIGTAGATIDSSGSGAVVFSNTGDLGREDAEDRTGDLDDFTGSNPPDLIYNVEDITGTIPAFTQNIVPGMSVTDPDADSGFFTFGNCAGANGENCLPMFEDDQGLVKGEAGFDESTATNPITVTVTGISADGTTIGISHPYPFIQKLDTRLVFGTVERTLTLTGSNGDDNTLASAIGDSPMGGVVALDKTGSGKWVLTGSNTYTGDTTIEGGILSITDAFLADSSDVHIESGGTLDLDFVGADVIDELFIDGSEESLPDGIYGATDGGMGYNVLPHLTGTGFLNVGGVPFPLSALTAVPEPSAFVLALVAAFGLAGVRNRAA